MRSVLVWLVYGLLPQSAEDVSWILFVTFRTIAFILFIAMVTFISTLWRDHIDTWSMFLAQWAEEVALGKRGALDSITGLKLRFVRFKNNKDNSRLNTETTVSKEKTEV